MLKFILLSLFFTGVFTTAYGQSCSNYFQYTRNAYGGIEGLISLSPFRTTDHQLSAVLTYSGNVNSVSIDSQLFLK
jgi:hypothetical protein